MPLSRGTQLTLGAATAVEAFAGVSLLLRPRRFVQSAYRVDRVDPLAEKYARCVAARPHWPLAQERGR